MRVAVPSGHRLAVVVVLATVSQVATLLSLAAPVAAWLCVLLCQAALVVVTVDRHRQARQLAEYVIEGATGQNATASAGRAPAVIALPPAGQIFRAAASTSSPVYFG